jgi:hypothetical protein
VQNILSSSFLSKILKIKIYITVILPAVLYGCETWSLIFREEPRLRVLENRVLRRVFGPKRDEVRGNGENYIMRSFMISTAHPKFLLHKIGNHEMGGACSKYRGEERCIQVFGGETWGKETTWKTRA